MGAGLVLRLDRRISARRSDVLALVPFEGFGGFFVGEEGVAVDGGEGFFDLGGGYVEELAAFVDQVDASVGEGAVELCFEADGVVGEDDGVDVVAKGHGCVTELSDTVEGFVGSSLGSRSWCNRKVCPSSVLRSPPDGSDGGQPDSAPLRRFPGRI